MNRFLFSGYILHVSNTKTLIVVPFFLYSVVYHKMCSALKNKRLVKRIKQASPIEQTSCLEGFHSVLNQFSPKMIGYSYRGMFCRYCSITGSPGVRRVVLVLDIILNI